MALTTGVEMRRERLAAVEASLAIPSLHDSHPVVPHENRQGPAMARELQRDIRRQDSLEHCETRFQ